MQPFQEGFPPLTFSKNNYFSLPLLQIHPLKESKEIEAKPKLDDPTDIYGPTPVVCMV